MYMIKIPQNMSSLSERSTRSTLKAAFQGEKFLPGCSTCLGCSEISSCPFNDIMTKTKVPNKFLGINDPTLTDLHEAKWNFTRQRTAVPGRPYKDQ